MSLEWDPTHPDKLASFCQSDKNVRCRGGRAGHGWKLGAGVQLRVWWGVGGVRWGGGWGAA